MTPETRSLIWTWAGVAIWSLVGLWWTFAPSSATSVVRNLGYKLIDRMGGPSVMRVLGVVSLIIAAIQIAAIAAVRMTR